METIRTTSWAEFESALNRVRTQYGTHRRTRDDGTEFEKPVGILFRGESRSTSPLSTTLERKSGKTFDVLGYIALAARAKHELESFTGHKWEVPEFPDLEAEIKQKQETFRVHLPAYEFLVYLRHHGYPSPLLDWTESPYIAAFFSYLSSENADPAVYCYIERPNLVKGGSSRNTRITVLGPYVSTDRRHFAQKAWYTIATRWNASSSAHQFHPHSDVFSRNDASQDVLVKIELSKAARSEALRKLSDYNINHFTLFQSEDALVRALEFKHFDLHEA